MENIMTSNLYNPMPHSKELELRTLGALIAIGEPNHLDVQQALLLLNANCFYDMKHRIIFETIVELCKLGKQFDLVDLMSAVPPDVNYLLNDLIADKYFSKNYLAQDIQILIDYRDLRNQVKILSETINQSIEKILPGEGLALISQNLQQLTRSGTSNRKSITRAYEEIIDEYLSDSHEDDSEIKVDIPNLPPVPNKALITIAGRSGHGKTFFALYLMDKLIEAIPDKQTLYFNLEMHEHVMIERHAILLGHNCYSRKETITSALGELLAKRVSLISVPLITIEEIETESRIAALRQPIGIIVVDYIGLIRSKIKGERNDLEQLNIAKRLAALSMDLNCIVIALTQVNREAKMRPIGKRCPQPTDSSESMGTVHSSSWWIGIDQPSKDSSEPEWDNQFMVACRKNRGAGGNFELKFKFMGGTFSKWVMPFCPVKPKPEMDGF